MEDHLKLTYGFNEFRDYQKDIICDLLKGENVFAILPTGGGKSLLYQFPATFTGKITIVVSPLISLMNDQCMYLNSKNIKSVCLNSETCIEISEYKKYKIIYATPEFMTSRIALFGRIKDEIGLFAIDESHCVSQWSHDFRVSYLELGIIKTTYPDIPMLAVTATATPRVVDDIYEFLNIDDVNEYSLGTRRTNLAISVHPKKAFDSVVFTEPTIVYVQTRKICESLCEKIQRRGVKAAHYHGGMSKADKNRSHELFVKCEVLVIVATISFGMGIDKSDIRHVINYGVTNDIETYYQEIGRAGRDGMPCKASMYYNPQDFATVQFLIKQSSCDKQIKLKMGAMAMLRDFLNETTICRQQMIDYYFEHGNLPTESEAAGIPSCDMCDNCKGDYKEDMIDISEVAAVIVRLMRENYCAKGFSYGVGKTVDMLKKSSHPVLFTKTKAWLKEVLQILISKSVLTSVAGEGYGATIQVSNKDVKSFIPIRVRMSSGVHKKNTATNETKLDRLYDIRTTMAEKHKVIPSMFINDRVIMNIHNKKPKTLTDLWNVDGISQEFTMTYGPEFMEKYKSKKPKEKALIKSKPREIALKLYKEGKSLGEICEITGKKMRTVEEQILHIFENDEDVDIDPEYFGLTEEYEAEIKEAVSKVGKEFLRPIKESVNANITYAHIKLCLIIME